MKMNNRRSNIEIIADMLKVGENDAVERAHRTHTEEFYEVTESSFTIAELRGEL